MDCAKTIGAVVTNSIEASELSKPGIIKKAIPKLICIPTTAGTGSETTFGAVVRDEELQMKYVVVSIELFPKVAVLDPELLRNLPKPVSTYAHRVFLILQVDHCCNRNGCNDSCSRSIC